MSHELVYDHFLRRMLTLFGEPKTTDLAAFMAEYAQELSGYTQPALEAGVTWLKRNHEYKSWPTIAVCRKAIHEGMPPQQAVASKNWGAPVPAAPKSDAKQRVASMVADLSGSVARSAPITVRASELARAPVKPLSDAERRERFNARIREGEAELYARDRAHIRARMASWAGSPGAAE